MLFYTGDNDSLVPTQGSQQWINELGWKVTNPWIPYFYTSDEGTTSIIGYTESRGNFTFATFHGSGHMAPRSKSAKASFVINNFINKGNVTS